ncbi:hypothetical protein CJU90_1172 [Yarrowia sp. C11]|nr:hypothetical protein CKK34_2585 [Yarrowia sp. E02]KAG5373468.1 hypothetical protein CJU90_1172 [Yarrowia sp. C11]
MTAAETIFIVCAVVAILLAVVFLPQINGLGSYKPVAKKPRNKKLREDDILEEPENSYDTYQPPTTSQIQSRDTSSQSSTTFRKRVNDRLNDVADSAPVTFRPVVRKPVSQPRSSGSGIARHVDENFDLDEFWEKEAANDVKDSHQEEIRRQKEEQERVDFARNEDNV